MLPHEEKATPMAEKPKSNQASKPMLETAHVLFIDIVGYSKSLLDDQTERLQVLQGIVRNTQEFQRAQETDALLRLPTGDGMALTFFGDAEAPVRCAVELSHALKGHPQIELRMGVHSGLVFRISDINANMNVAGGGINIAQRVMDCGDAGHILLSKRVADDLGQLARWADDLHDLGETEVKHGVRLHIFNLYDNETGNASVPSRFREKPLSSTFLRRAAIATSFFLITILLMAALFWIVKKYNETKNTSAIAPTGPTSDISLDRSFDYSITVQEYRNGKPFQKPYVIPGEINFNADDRIQLSFASLQDGYLYLINRGPNIATNSMILYPDSGKSAFISANQQVSVPAPSADPEEDWIRFDNDWGTEQLWIIWAVKPVPVFEAVKKWSNPTDLGEIKDARQDTDVRQFLESQEGALAEGKRDLSGTKTTVRGKSDMVTYRITLQHH